MQLFLAVLFTGLNGVLWAVMLVRFKRLFSTDDIIARTRAEMNNMVRDIDQTTERNITLLEDRTRRLKALIAEADKHVQLAEQELERARTAAALHERVTRSGKRAAPGERRAAEKYRAIAASENRRSVGVGSGVSAATDQGSLFSLSSDGTENPVTVTEHEEAFPAASSVPPPVYFAEQPVVYEKTFDESVMELYGQGYAAEDISHALSCSLTEVQFVIDLSHPQEPSAPPV
ncbi:MAG: hypothetical protein IJ191_05735 [Treponema sp.]|nr:hypothetical protein [Treponema sp.]